MTSVLISRFILNLRGAYESGGYANSSLHLSRLSDIRFANSIVGDLSTPLGFEGEEHTNLTNRPEGTVKTTGSQIYSLTPLWNTSP